MNFVFFLKKGTLIFLFFLCFVISLSCVEASQSIRIKRTKSHVVPRHISLLARSGSGTYARRYSYGRPLPNFSVNLIRNKRNFRKNRRNGGRTYASGFRNWTPNRGFPGGGRNNPRVDNIRNAPHKKRKEPYGFINEPHFGSTKQKRRIRPQRFNPGQRPFPPKQVKDFEEEYFFPEEPKRGETKYEFENRFPRPKKKRRNPGEVEKFNKKPEVKFPYFEEKPFKKLKDSPVSYSTYIQHPSGYHDDLEEYYEDGDGDYSRPSIRNKKKRVKKKTNNPRKKNKDEEYSRPYSFDNDEPYSPAYLNSDDYELPLKSVKKPTKVKASNEDKFATKGVLYSKQKNQVGPSLFSADTDSVYKGSSKIQESAQFNPTYSQSNPSYSQSWSSLIETTARPLQSVQYQTESGFQPQHVPTQYNYQNRDYSSLQKTKTVSTNTQQATYYSQPDNTYKNFAYNNNYVNNQVTSTNAQSPTNYNYNAYSNNVYSNQPLQTFSQPVSSGSTFFSDVSVQKSVPIYDNTETFYNFNNNAYVNSQSSKYFDSDGHKYSNRISFKNPTDKTDTDDFIKKHQNLYNNGLSGVPVQGDGFAKDSTKKDYDIGYGDFQFDENPTA